MTNIIKSSKELSKKELYILMCSDGTIPFKDCAGKRIKIAMWVQFNDIDNNGVEKEILSIMDVNGVVYGGNSPTFARKFLEAADMLGEELEEIEVLSGTSKSGKEFTTCRAVL